MRINYKRKSTISMKMFISEFGQNFSDHMKKRLMELDVRSVLTRKEIDNILDLKHVEHTKYESNKEYAYCEFAVIDGILYVSESCIEDDRTIQSDVVDKIYKSLESECVTFEDKKFKKVDDSNIDFVVDSILSVCPQVSQKYVDIVEGIMARANDK